MTLDVESLVYLSLFSHDSSLSGTLVALVQTPVVLRCVRPVRLWLGSPVYL